MENETENSSKQNEKKQRKSKLEKVNEQIAELEEVRKQLQSKENEKKRKARTQRLIQIGAITLKYLNCSDDIEPKEFEKLLKSSIAEMPKRI